MGRHFSLRLSGLADPLSVARGAARCSAGLFTGLALLGLFGPGALAGAAKRVDPELAVDLGYEIIVLDETPGALHSVPDINDRGDVVWSRGHPTRSDLFLYRDGVVRQFSSGEWLDDWPAINNHGHIAWLRGHSWSGPFEVVYDTGAGPTVIPSPGGITAIRSPHINDSGLLVWSQRLALDPSRDEVFLFDGQAVRQISNSGLSNQVPRLNRHGDMVWTEYDFRSFPWTSAIMYYSEGQITPLTDRLGTPQSADLNDHGQVVWGCRDGCGLAGIRQWANGQTLQLTVGRDAVARINNLGQVIFVRWSEAQQHWQQHMISNTQIWPIPMTGVDSSTGSINDRGEIAWREIRTWYPDTAIYLMRRIEPARSSGPLRRDVSRSTEARGFVEGGARSVENVSASRTIGLK